MTEKVTCGLCGEPMPPGEEMFKYHGYSGDCPKPPLPKSAPKVPHVEHDDNCVWWDNVGVEPLNYACTCGKWAEFVELELSRAQAALRKRDATITDMRNAGDRLATANAALQSRLTAAEAGVGEIDRAYKILHNAVLRAVCEVGRDGTTVQQWADEIHELDERLDEADAALSPGGQHED